MHGSVAGAGLLRNQRASMPRLLERWGTASRRSWRRNGGGNLTELALVFANVVLTKTLGVRQAKEIRARITRRMDLW